MAGHNEPKLLFSVDNIRAFHLQHGEESVLTPSGPQTLSLLMVPTSNAFADLSIAEPQSSAPEEDFYLHLHLPPEIDLPLPATTQVYHQPPNSYLIPRWDLGPDSGAFTRIEFPPIGSSAGKVTQEDIDTFETILAQCTSFLERSQPPKDHDRYNPADYAPGEGYVDSGSDIGNHHGHGHGQIVLVDEENGSVVGELHDFNVVERPGIKPGSKNPVELRLPAEGQGNQITVDNVSEDYLSMARHPAYQNSTIVQTSATASRLVVTGSSYLARAMSSGAESFTQKTKPNPKPMTFTDTTHQRIRKINTFSQSAAGLSAKTVGQVSRYAQNFGASMARKGEKDRMKKGFDKDGRPISDYKPGILNKSMIAFSTLADGIDHGARALLTSGSAAATTVVGHKYGAQAGQVAGHIAGGAKNVGLVYIDAAGVSRKAVIKSVAKGMVVGKMPNGNQLVVGTGDGGVVPTDALPAEAKQQAGIGGASAYKESNEYLPGTGVHGPSTPGAGIVGYGNQAPPPSYSQGASGLGEPLQGQWAPDRKR
ncbi:putative protein spg20 [Phaeomoniella chlamydospora]|uniref:Senescence domain-containing protein n=1 Tax=Phaeomoniella chlamydospora TaxID=158046 RepID=A0A0G2GU58_PHACM|nr:putative protein spg20 [Phaeomoniella chlamydospora]